MKKLALLFFTVLCLCACSAQADTLQPYGMAFHYEVTSFNEKVPSAISSVLAKSIFADDECIGGAMVEQKGNGNNTVRAIMAVKRDGISVLLGISDKATPLAENFCPENSIFTARLIPSYTTEHASTDAAFFIEYGNRSVGFSIGDFHLTYGMTMDSAGNGWLIATGPYDGLEVIPLENGLTVPNRGHRYYADIPVSAEYWTFDTYPCTEQEAKTIVSYSPLDTNLFFVNGCNLRIQATSKSASLGVLTSSIPAEPTGNRKKGSQLPWIEVSINNITAWVPENYTVSNDSQIVYLMDSASRVTPVGRIKRELSVDGLTLEAGLLVYVVAEGDNKLLVCVPDGDMSWRMGHGTVIQIEKTAVVWAPTALQLKYME